MATKPAHIKLLQGIRTKYLIVLLLFTGCTGSEPAGEEPEVGLSLGDWGPYTERYAGISHVADRERGLRFDLSVFPVTPGKQNLPLENGGHAGVFTHWAAKPRLDDYTFRFIMDRELGAWCDVSYFTQDESSRLIRIDMHNASGRKWAGSLHLMAHLRYPPKDYFARIGHEPIRLGAVELPDGAVWVGSLDYEALDLASPDERDALPERGLLRREVREHGSVGGSLLGRGFGQAKGDAVSYRFELQKDIKDATILLRGRSEIEIQAAIVPSHEREFRKGTGEDEDDAEPAGSFFISGAAEGTISFPFSESFELASIRAGTLKSGSHELRLESGGGAGVMFDGFAVLSEELVPQVRFNILEPNIPPKIETVGDGRGVILDYPDLEQDYGYAILLQEEGKLRSMPWRELYPAFNDKIQGDLHNKVNGGGRYGKGDPTARFVDLGFDQQPLPDGGQRRYWGLVCRGDEEFVRSRLEEFLHQDPQDFEDTSPSFEVLPPFNPDGESYALSQQLMTATTAMNIIYPLLHERRYILAYEPSKAWSVLYTWDNGFHGIGLNLLDTDLSAELMYHMTTAPGAETPYIWGGSPMPIQFYQFHEWWNLCQDRETLAILYPRLRQMYEWFIGRSHGSNTRGPAKEGMISTYEYFYNLGWDDYPGHTFAGISRKKGWPAPVCQSIHTLIGARALGHAARELGLQEDVAVYEADARILERAILEYAWDGESGYFGYVVYDHDSGNPLGIIRGRRKKPSTERIHRDRDNLEVFIGGSEGVNINMGLDGTSPWYAGLGSPEQRERQFRLLSTEGRLWTSIGLLTVDLESPFSCPGYWIDRAWISPQWWYWKGALDQDKGEFAYRVAHAVLENAKRTAAERWSTYENYSYSQMEPGGTGLSFAGLSTPTLDFFYSYYVPGTLSFGHDAWVEEKDWSAEKSEVRAVIRFDQERPGENRLILACFEPGGTIKATWKGEDVPVEKVTGGAVYVRIPCKKEQGELVIRREG